MDQDHDAARVIVGSRDAVCRHEAGHAFVATASWVSVTGLHVGRPFPSEGSLLTDPSAKTPFVALGGVACELMLDDRGRVIDQDGRRPDREVLWRRLLAGGLAGTEAWAHDLVDHLMPAEGDPIDWPKRNWSKGFLAKAGELSAYIDEAVVERIALAMRDRTWLPGEELRR